MFQEASECFTRFHKRRLESQKRRANNVPSVSKQKNVNRHPLIQTPSANIVKNNNVEIADLRQEVSDLKETVCKLVNKLDGRYNSVFSDSTNAAYHNSEYIPKNIRRKKRKDTLKCRRLAKERETNVKFLKNFSNHQLTDNQVSVISKGFKFIPTPVTNENSIRQQLLRDFEQFARRMRLQYIFHGQNKEPHPFHVKSQWMPPVQPSIALERKADKGTTTVIMNKQAKINEAQVQLDNREHYKPLKAPIVKNTHDNNEIIDQMHGRP